MTDAPDPHIADLLRKDAPPARDPMFRIAVLRRLERAKYRRRLFALVACAGILAAAATAGVGLGGVTRETMGVVLIGAALAVAYVLTSSLTRFVTRFR